MASEVPKIWAHLPPRASVLSALTAHTYLPELTCPQGSFSPSSGPLSTRSSVPGTLLPPPRAPSPGHLLSFRQKCGHLLLQPAPLCTIPLPGFCAYTIGALEYRVNPLPLHPMTPTLDHQVLEHGDHGSPAHTHVPSAKPMPGTCHPVVNYRTSYHGT